MQPTVLLHQLLSNSAQSHPDSIALRDFTGQSMTYGELDALSTQVQRYLSSIGVQRGDRIGVCLRKSIDVIAVIFGILKAGGAYVPVDPAAPPVRSVQIMMDCGVQAVFLENRDAPAFRAALANTCSAGSLVNEERNSGCPVLSIDKVGGGTGLKSWLHREQPDTTSEAVIAEPQFDDLAYILYTSGSTGRPKGVKLTHRNAMSFIDWCSHTFSPSKDDCFSSHAPLHFDLSILDLYVSIKSAAVLVLIDETTGKSPGLLADLIAREKITIWYSTPSVLTLLLQYGKLEQHDFSYLRLILFAGEVFPIKHLRALKDCLPRPRYFNLYGPTETNVCTYYEIPEQIPSERSHPFPIGRACEHLQTQVVGLDEHKVSVGDEGELCVSGPSVTSGYWNQPDWTAECFLRDPSGGPWYKTGDLVVELPGGDYQFIGRRDRMVKRRGHRIELGEIEAALVRHPAVREVAVVVRSSPEGEAFQLIAVLAIQQASRPSIIELKGFCGSLLPASMIPDRFEFVESLPKTSTDKINYQVLVESAKGG